MGPRTVAEFVTNCGWDCVLNCLDRGISRLPHEADLPQPANVPWMAVERKTVACPALSRPSDYNAQDWSSALSCSGTSITSLVTGEMQTCVRLEVNAMTSGATLPSTRNVNE